MRYDFLIIGAGLSGSTCAHLLAAAGKSVLLVERLDASCKDKLCGGLMTPQAVREFGSVFGSSSLVRLFHDDHATMRILFGTHDRVVDIPTVVGVNRIDLDRFALSCALDSGVHILDRAKVDSFDFANLRAGVVSDGRSFDVEYGTLIVADGAGSSTRRRVAGFVGSDKVPVSGKTFPTLEAYVPSVSDQLTGRYIAEVNGYCWYAPCGDHANIGVGGSGVSSTSQMRDLLGSFADELGVALDPSSTRGACIPMGDAPVLSCPEVHAFFVGDAAGLANGITGEGIYYALRSAHALAQSLCADGSYASLMRRDLATLRTANVLLPVVYNKRNMDLVLSAAKFTNLGSGNAARLALKLFAGL